MSVQELDRARRIQSHEVEGAVGGRCDAVSTCDIGLQAVHMAERLKC